MTVVRTFIIPGLAGISLDTRDNCSPLLQIVLPPEYRGDLNDIASRTPGPDDLYLSCDQTSAINNPELAKFMEVMTHWDHTGDGNPDCDEIIDAIEEAFWQSREKPDEFHRPRDGWYTRAVMSIMPPAPERHIVFSFGELKPRFRWYHHLAALPMLALIFALIQLQVHLLPWTKYSVVTGFIAALGTIGVSSWIAIALFIIGYRVVQNRSTASSSTISPHTYGFFNRAAIFEEQAFREGSENWSLSQRTRSCLAFGAIHMVNLIYPLATILPIALGGGMLMVVYLRSYRSSRFRRTAVLTASVWHRVYNRMALIALAITLVTLLGYGVFSLIAVLAFTFADHRRRSRSTKSVGTSAPPLVVN